MERGEELQPENSIVLSSKLQGYRNSMAEPYFKEKQKMKPGENTELLKLRKQCVGMGRDFQSLLTAHEKQESSVIDLRQKVRALRLELEGREKSLDLARRTLDRLAAEKGALEAGAAGTQAYVRKLEGRLLSVQNAAELQQRLLQYKSRLDQMAHALHQADCRAAAAQEASARAQLDVTCLKRGLELAAEQLTKYAGAEVPGTLLRAVARGQEEAMGLSQQLSDAKQQAAQLSVALEQAREHLQAQQHALEQQQSDRCEVRKRAEAAEGALEKQQAVTAELRRVLDALRPKAGALAEERDALQQELEMQRTAAAEAQKEVKQLRVQLRQKATIESALRDELRRVMAGEGATPSPLTKHTSLRLAASGAAGTAAAAGQRGKEALQRGHAPAMATGAFRGGASRADSRQQQPAAAGAGGWSADKAVMRLSSAWEQQQHLAAMSPPSGSLKGRYQQYLPPGDLDLDFPTGSPSDDSIAAEPSPTRALLRLQEQRRQRQGSRLGSGRQLEVEQQQQQLLLHLGQMDLDAQLPPAVTRTPAAAAARAAADQGTPHSQPGHRAFSFVDASEPVSPASSCGAPPAGRPEQQERQQQPRRQRQQVLREPQQQAVAALQQQLVRQAEVLPVADGRLMQLYTSALDEQIALLETDLAHLSGAPSPITQLQQAARAAAAGTTAAAAAAAPGAASSPVHCRSVAEAGAATGQPPLPPQQSPAAKRQLPGATKAGNGSGGSRASLLAAPPHRHSRIPSNGSSRQWQAAQQQSGSARHVSIGAWRPNNAFEGAADRQPAPAAGRPPVLDSSVGSAEHGSLGSSSSRGMQQQLLSPGGGSTPAGSDSQGSQAGRDPVMPHLWHTNPLAAGPPLAQQQPGQQQQQGAELCEGGQADGGSLDGALPHARCAAVGQQARHADTRRVGQACAHGSGSGRGRPPQPLDQRGGCSESAGVSPVAAAEASLAAAHCFWPATQAGAASPSPAAAGEEEWQWGQLQQAGPVVTVPSLFGAATAHAQQRDQQQLPQVASSTAASSPSLRLPASPRSPRQQARQQGAAAENDSGGDQQQQRQQHSRAAEPAASEGGGSQDGGAAHSISHHWELPHEGAGNSDWLSTEYEPDIEQLEVNSSMTPMRQQQQQQQAWWENRAAVAAGLDEGSRHHQRQQEQRMGGQQEQRCAASSGWADAWEGSCGSSEHGEAAPLVPDQQRRQQQQEQQQAAPVLPGLPLVASSRLAPGLPQPPHQTQQQQHTLFDLAGMDLQEFLS